MGDRFRALTLGIVSVVLVIAFEATAVNTAMPVAAGELDGFGLYAFAFSGYFTTTLFALVVSGQWCDRSGPLRPCSPVSRCSAPVCWWPGRRPGCGSSWAAGRSRASAAAW